MIELEGRVWLRGRSLSSSSWWWWWQWFQSRRPRSTPALTAPRLLLVVGCGNGDRCSLVCLDVHSSSVGSPWLVLATLRLRDCCFRTPISPTQTFMPGPLHNNTLLILGTTRFATIASAWSRSLHYFAPDGLVSLYCPGIAAAHGGRMLSSLFLGLVCVLPHARHDW